MKEMNMKIIIIILIWPYIIMIYNMWNDNDNMVEEVI